MNTYLLRTKKFLRKNRKLFWLGFNLFNVNHTIYPQEILHQRLIDILLLFLDVVFLLYLFAIFSFHFFLSLQNHFNETFLRCNTISDERQIFQRISLVILSKNIMKKQMDLFNVVIRNHIKNHKITFSYTFQSWNELYLWFCFLIHSIDPLINFLISWFSLKNFMTFIEESNKPCNLALQLWIKCNFIDIHPIFSCACFHFHFNHIMMTFPFWLHINFSQLNRFAS